MSKNVLLAATVLTLALAACTPATPPADDSATGASSNSVKGGVNVDVDGYVQ